VPLFEVAVLLRPPPVEEQNEHPLVSGVLKPA
jgi:hypothetical protein